MTETHSHALVYSRIYTVKESKFDRHQEMIDDLLAEIESFNDETIRLYALMMPPYRKVEGRVVTLLSLCSTRQAFDTLMGLATVRALFTGLREEELLIRDEISAVSHRLLGSVPALPVLPWTEEAVDMTDIPF